ncbi:MAG: ThiF family adenylyltransferase [Candidatus Micrarchaeota archaeon]
MDIIYQEKFFRNLGLDALSKKEHEKIAKTNFCIIGVGGTGCAAIEMLARMGAQNFTIFDYDRVELSNFNRQIFTTDNTIDRKKTDVAKERIHLINSNAKVKTYFEKFESKDIKKIKNCDIIIDCSDSVTTHIEIDNASKKLKIPFVCCSANNSIGLVSIFSDKTKFETVFQINKKNMRAYLTCRSILAPVANISGNLAAMQAVNKVIGKQFVKAPDVLFFDLFRNKEMFYVKRLE